ncbi:GNAT family N-acetyltransferase [Anaeromicropila populeti]|uniref:Acetyltransferase (GNAT) domain-containing protein n=1 Tax=Anaeromicropila populeti TaxID=37658 RepID=A0A1I6HKN5_9FIRM|nr:GNAT family N-acetyltransferase [Anaeromicropila populeti]SFR54996.1 Acetyltransferase (GNAT) domain-containing protein [Anaeromicropila populeti]
MVIKKLEPEKMDSAIELVWKVFQEYEAPDYPVDGVTTFYNCIHDSLFLATLKFYGAFERDKLIGVIATRSAGSHISLFFVESSYQQKGIGRLLFEKVLLETSSPVITVHSSPYAVEVYHKLGFVDRDKEQLTAGIRYTPMQYIKDKLK